MRLNARSLLWFMSKFLLILLAFTLTTPVVLPIYGSLQIGLLQPVVGSNFKMRLEHNGSIYVYFRRDPEPVVRREATSFTGLGLLIALFLATLIPWRRRLSRLGLGLGALLLFHLIALLGLIDVWKAVAAGRMSPLQQWEFTVIAGGDLLVPVVLWALLTFRNWFPKPTAAIREHRVLRNG